MRFVFGAGLHLIAEIGVNHEGDLNRALQQIGLAARGGASSVKFQFYKSELLASELAGAYWDKRSEPTESQVELFRKYDAFGAEDFRLLSEEAHRHGLDFGLSVFHLDAVDEVASFVDYFKVASGDINYFELHDRMASHDKPLVFSTGAASAEEVETVFTRFQGYLAPIAFLQCTLCYPTRIADANVGSLTRLQELTPGRPTGVSDHIADDSPLRFQLALALGGSVFEKHFSDTPGTQGNDHYHSWGVSEFETLGDALKEAQLVLGPGELLLDSEASARYGARRSIFFARAMSEGDYVSADDLVALRPSSGLPPSESVKIVGRKLACNVHQGDLVRNEMFL